MSGFLKRLSRSRGNSTSYVEDSYQRSSASPTAGTGPRPPSSYQSPAQFRDDTAVDPHLSATLTSPVDPDHPVPREPMYPSSGGGGGYATARTQPLQTNGMRASRGQSSAGDSGYMDGPTTPAYTKESPYERGVPQSAQSGNPPDLLTRAFNEAIRPYTEKIEQLEEQMADLQEYVRSQDQQRMEIFAWIDKRGLRPGELTLLFCIISLCRCPQRMIAQ